jgi:disulfide bond formation protein DsbB
MIFSGMHLVKGFKVSAVIALAVPALLALTAITTMADASPSPSPSAVALPGDPAKGQALYNANCATCHGANLEGGIGATLNPIQTLRGVSNPLDPTFLISIITNGRPPQSGDPKSTPMPAKGGNPNLTDQDVKDLAAFIIQSNQINPSSLPLPPGELAKRTILWVSISIVAMGFITFLLAQYNMRWIARRAAARRR